MSHELLFEPKCGSWLGGLPKRDTPHLFLRYLRQFRESPRLVGAALVVEGREDAVLPALTEVERPVIARGHVQIPIPAEVLATPGVERLPLCADRFFACCTAIEDH